jgi:hypothetical protein
MGFAALFGLVVGIFALSKSRTYSSESAFIPQVRKSPGEASGIAAQFGLAVPLGDPTQTPAFYADLLISRDILRAAVATRRPQSLLKAFWFVLLRKRVSFD